MATVAVGLVSCMPPAVKMKARVVHAAGYGPLVEVYEYDHDRILSGEGGMLFDWVRFVAIDDAVPGLALPLSDAGAREVRLKAGVVIWEIRPKTSEISWLPVSVYHPKRVATLTYGHAPVGYEQIVPPAGAPPPLEAKRLYAVQAKPAGSEATGTLLFVIDEAGTLSFARPHPQHRTL